MRGGAHRVEQAKADVIALRHDLQRGQAFADFDEARGLALPGHTGVAHQRRRGIDDVEHRAVAVVLAPTARSRAASCVARSLRLISVASDTGLGLPRPRAPAFCSSGSIVCDAAVGIGRDQPDQPVLQQRRGTARRLRRAAAQRQDRRQRLAPTVLGRTDEERQPHASSGLRPAAIPPRAAPAAPASACRLRRTPLPAACAWARTAAASATSTRSHAASSRWCSCCSDCSIERSCARCESARGALGASPSRWSMASTQTPQKPKGSAASRLPASAATNLRALVQAAGVGSASSAIT